MALPGDVRENDLTVTVPVKQADAYRSTPERVRGASTGAKLLIAANVVTAALYVKWWLTPGHAGNRLLFALLAIAECFTLVQAAGYWGMVWATRFRPPPRQRQPRTVDVFVATCGEPLEILRTTVEAAVAMEGPHETFVLDDARRDEVRDMVRNLGAWYVSRDSNRGAKAGNLNHALGFTTGELVAFFDADHVPRQDFLTRILGYFEDDEVGFVQTPQFYGNARDSEVARGAFHQQSFFYGPMCRGKNGLGAAFCCGTNVVFRRRVLEEVGGFDEGSVVEDFVTSMHLHRRGVRSVYYPYLLAEGMGPDTLRSYFRQQFRWARGSIGALLSLEPFKRGFSLRQRMQYLLASTYYLVGLVTVIYLLLPILYLLFGWSPFSVESGSFLFFYAPYLVAGLLTVRWGMGGRLHLENLWYTFGTFPVYAAAAVAALTGRKPTFGVTGRKEAGGQKVPALAWVSIGAYACTVVAIGAGLILRPFSARTLTNVAWATVNLCLLTGIVRVGWDTFTQHRAAAAGRRTAGQRPGVPAQVVETANGQAPATVTADRTAGWLSNRNLLILPEEALADPRRDPDVEPRATRSRARWRVGAITAVGLALRVALINAQSLRLDESLFLAQAQPSALEIWDGLLSADVHTPLYHTILHFWMRLAGTSEWALRVPSVVFGTAAIPLLYLIGRRLIGARVGLLAAAIGATSPFWVWHSDEAKMYPLLLFLVLAAVQLLFLAVDKGGLRRWAAYAVVTALSFYTHYFAALMVPVHLTYILLQPRRRRLVLRWAAAAAGIVVLFSPWMIAFYLKQVGSGVTTYQGTLTPSTQDYSLMGISYGLLFFNMMFVAGYGQVLSHGSGFLGGLTAVVVGGWPLVALFGSMSRGLGRWFRSHATAFLVAWLVFTVGVVFVLAVKRPGLWHPRYLIGASPAVFLGLAWAISKLLRRVHVEVVAAVIVAVLATATVADNFQVNNEVREDFRGASAIIERGLRPGDAVLVMPYFYGRPFKYYFKEAAPLVGLFPVQTREEVVASLDHPTITEMQPGSSLWVLLAFDNAFDTKRVFWPYFDETYQPVSKKKLGGHIELRRYRVPPRPVTAPPAPAPEPVAPTDPAPTDPGPTQPGATDPQATEPAEPAPAGTNPGETEPAETEPTGAVDGEGDGEEPAEPPDTDITGNQLTPDG